MKSLFEYTDMLLSPIDIFKLNQDSEFFPVHSHWHYFVEILFCSQGEATVLYNDQVHCLKQNEMIFIPPQTIHAISLGPDKNSFEIIGIKFNLNKIILPGDYLPNIHMFFQNSTNRNLLRLHFFQNDFKLIELKSFFDICLQEVTEKKYGYDSYVYSYLATLITKLLRIWHDDHPAINYDVLRSASGEYSIQEIQKYIDEHCHQKINVQELAAKCNMSYSYFAKQFKYYFGQSCKQYIEFMRLAQAENLLMYTELDLNYIAEETGFADCSHFIRSFKRKYGITPKQFRLQRRNL